MNVQHMTSDFVEAFVTNLDCLACWLMDESSTQSTFDSSDDDDGGWCNEIDHMSH